MYDITNYVSLSKLKNDTFRFGSTTYDDPDRTPTYTPYRIATWMYGDTPHLGPRNNGHLLHEIAHAIEMYWRDHSRLLLTNFGYPRIRGEAWSRKVMETEARVVGIQARLAMMDQSFFLVSPYRSFYYDICDNFEGHKPTMTAQEFCELADHHYCNTKVEDLLYAWYDLCHYVKQNRK